MTEILLALLSLAVGAVIGYLLLKSKSGAELEVAKSNAIELQRRLEEVTRGVSERESRINDLRNQLLTESNRRAGLEAEVKRIEQLDSEIFAKSDEIQRLHASLQTETAQRSTAEEKSRRIPALEGEIGAAQRLYREQQEQLARLREQVAELETNLEAEKKASLEKLDIFEQAQKKVEQTFQALSHQALQANNSNFLDLAKSEFARLQDASKGDLDKRQTAISELVRPVGETLNKFNDRVRELELKRETSYTELTTQLRTLADGQTQLRSETTNLVQALRRPSGRGRWGEIQLKRVVEMAGMQDHCDFREQVSENTEDGKQRPDMIVMLPGGKNIIVDAKAPLAAILDAFNSDDDNFRREKMKDHARHVRNHIALLSKKSYWEQFQPTPEFVVLFLPGEAFLYAALEQDPMLIEDGITDRVIIATPTTLIAMLKAISYGWRQENMAQNAREISDLGVQLYNRLNVVGDHFTRLGGHLGKAVDSFNSTVSSMERNVLSTARKLKEHGVAAAGAKELEDLKQIESTPRLIEKAELQSTTTEPIVLEAVGTLFAGE